MERISSRQNPLVQRFREVARSRRHDVDGRDEVLLDGLHLVTEALDAHVSLDVVAFGEGMDSSAGTLARRASAAGARTVVVSAAVLEAISPVRQPSGIVAIARAQRKTIDRIFEHAPQLVVILAGVQDPGNVGAIIRTAEACGATGIITTSGTADPFGWKALRGSMGSAFRVPSAAHASADGAIAAASRAGLRVFAAVPRDGTLLPAARLTGPAAILLGGEGSGLQPAILASADERIVIPMKPPVESLNVATAAALILYEASRQRERHTHVPLR